MKKGVFYLLAIVIPIASIVILELALRLTPWYYSYPLFIEVPTRSDYLMPNPEYGHQYFADFTPSLAVNAFRKEKPDSSIRIVVLGGSTASGFPYSFNLSFATQLERHFRLNYPHRNPEVINLGMTATNSFQLVDMLHHIDEIKPDLIAIYSGNNEFYGAYGSASHYGDMFSAYPIKKWVMKVKRTALFQTSSALASLFSFTDEDRRSVMAKSVKEVAISENSPIFAETISNYRKNLELVVRHFDATNIPVVISTIGVNLKDQSPLGNSAYAENLYWDAWKVLENGEFDEALSKLEEAKDLDPLRVRAPKQINDVIEDITTSYSNAFLVDGKNTLRVLSASGIEDYSIFTDYIHPNTRGQYVLSRDYFDVAVEALNIQQERLAPSYAPPLPYSLFDDAFARLRTNKLVGGYPFQQVISPRVEEMNFRNMVKDLQSSSSAESLAVETYVNNLPFVEMLGKAAEIRLEEGDTLSFSTHTYSLSNWQVLYPPFFERALEITMSSPIGKPYALEMALMASHYHPDIHFKEVAAELLIEKEEFDVADHMLKTALRQDPGATKALWLSAKLAEVRGDSLGEREFTERYRNSLHNVLD